MSDTYGVTDTGFDRKPLDAILADNEEAARTIFGQAVILDAESPMGQLLGLLALLQAQVWEQAEDTYHSFDPDQSEGTRLDMIGRIRAVERPEGESDADYRRRITNAGRNDIHLRPMINDLHDIDGVEYVKVWINDTNETDDNGIPGHSLAVAVIGGDDEAVAAAIFARTVSGIGVYGTTIVEIDDAGYCRSVGFLRPTQVPIRVEMDVRARPVSGGCATPDQAAIAAQIDETLGFTADFGLKNGEDVTAIRIIGAVAQLQGLDVIAVRLTRDTDTSGAFEVATEDDVEIPFDEIAVVEELQVNYL